MKHNHLCWSNLFSILKGKEGADAHTSFFGIYMYLFLQNAASNKK